jgi:hypothetical protein
LRFTWPNLCSLVAMKWRLALRFMAFVGLSLGASLSAPLSAQETSLTQASQRFLDSQSEFYKSLEVEAMGFYERHQKDLGHIKRTQWQKMVRKSVYHVKSAGVGIKELARYAKPAAKTFVVSNILSTFVLPPILTAVGQPGLAMLVLAVPFEPFLAGAQVMLTQAWGDMKLMSQIGVTEYRQYRQMRSELLGMSSRSHILTLIEKDILKEFETDPQARWLVVTRGSAGADKLLGHSISLPELESLLRKSKDGSQILEELMSEKLSTHLYTLEVWAAIQERDELRKELQETLKARFRAGTSTSHLNISRQLHEGIDLRRQLDALEEELSKSLKKAKRGASSLEVKQLKELRTDLGLVTRRIIQASERSEMEILLAFSRGETPSLDLEDSLQMMREAHHRYRKVLVDVSNFSQDRRMTVASLRTQLILEGPRVSGLIDECTRAFRAILGR